LGVHRARVGERKPKGACAQSRGLADDARVAEQLEPVAAGGEGLIALKIKKPARLVVDRPGVNGGVVCDREGAWPLQLMVPALVNGEYMLTAAPLKFNTPPPATVSGIDTVPPPQLKVP